MDYKDIEKQIDEIDHNFFDLKKEEVENIKPEISPDPPLPEIKKLLGELPSQIDHLKTKSVECKKYIRDIRLQIKFKKQNREIKMSEIRQESLSEYVKENKQFFKTFQEKFGEKSKDQKPTRGLSKAGVQEIIKNLKPEKPTKNDLDDIANIKTALEADEIYKLESKLNEFEHLYELLQTKAEKYENKFISARAHKGILVEELKNKI